MTHLKVGDLAPDLKGVDQDDREVSLNDYKGKKLVLFFYPKDNTPGCTAEACNLSSNEALLKKEGYEILGVSPDTEKKHKNFIAKYNLVFPLIADVDKNWIESFGIWGPKKFMGRVYDGVHRTTFIINEQAKIVQIFDKVKTKTHTEQILEWHHSNQ